MWFFFSEFSIYEKCLPQFIGGQIHSMEITQTVAALNIFADQTELTEWALGIIFVLQISQWDFVHAVFQTFRCNFCTLCTINQCFSNLALGKHVWCFDIIPIFTRKWINNLLFGSFFASLWEPLILADCHLARSKFEKTE